MSWTVPGAPLSPFVRKVTVAMNLKQVSYDLDHTVSPFGLPDGFDKLNPLKRIPVVKHNDKVLADSGVICRYLDKTCPEPALTLTDLYLQARAGIEA